MSARRRDFMKKHARPKPLEEPEKRKVVTPSGVGGERRRMGI